MNHGRRSRRTWRYCLRCRAIVQNCPCTQLLQGFYRPIPELPSTDLDIDDVEATPDEDVVNISNEDSRQDLNLLAPTCNKSDQHGDFISVNSFSMDHLPIDLRDATFYVWLRNCVPIIVRLVTRQGRRATGRATVISQELGEEKNCIDTDCPHNAYGPHSVFGGLGIITNKHVVQNVVDAQGTKVEFFYSDNESRRFTVEKERGYSGSFVTNKTMDYTTFSCYVHNRDIIDIIKTCDNIRNAVWKQIPQCIRDKSKDYAIIISHPHGSPKKISIGKVIMQDRREPDSRDDQMCVMILRDLYNICILEMGGQERFLQYFQLIPNIQLPYSVTWYTTATCKGSSGAPVFMGSVVGEGEEEINQAHTHRGADDTGNYCCT